MLHYAAGFLLSALIAAVLGFGDLIAGAAGIAKTLFVVFVLGAVATLLLHRSRI
jgi:uncharacterized membrane protein YtjA (UPF0391 family)